jgi:hypothetical protein
MRTTSPYPVYRSTRDTRNAPLWNPSSKELTSVEDDEAGRLASFRARYGRSFDASSTSAAEEEVAVESPPSADAFTDVSGPPEATPKRRDKDAKGVQALEELAGGGVVNRGDAPTKTALPPRVKNEEIDDGWDFGDDDSNMLDLISSYGQENIKAPPSPVKKGKK